MKTNQFFHRAGLSASVLAAIMLLNSSCSKNEEPQPVAKNHLLVYTKSFSKNADRIEVFLDGNSIGLLTRGYIDLTGNGPGCSAPASGSLINVETAVGKHMLEAKEYKGDQKVGSWAAKSIQIDDYACSAINLNNK